ncbi:metallophosphoesterase [Rhodobaculum claviforme]|uniref:Serine/threonine protein phosphatase n=1 Tax=Rhodobaculum claviforme TaxID=1549854 RepID=A0A934TIX9_9RHOB|nr:metallophosphoesterase [Rhodobaculum claviforme]MBK5926052.1 serine/threonine protein phosphatase [Rhodobaculum claviforme]
MDDPVRSYAVGDVHGQLGRLRAAHALIAADRARTGDADAPVIHLGDLVDRGPDSRGVIAWLMAGIADGAPWRVLLGNHDRLFTMFLDDPTARDPMLRPIYSWLHPAIGGGPTLASYGVANPADRPVAKVHADAVARVPAEHRAFLAGCALWHRRGPVLFVHAGIRPGIDLEAQDPIDLTWIREPFLSDPRDHGVLVVHGHTALERATHFGNRVDLDTRAGYGGPVTAAVFEGRRVHILTDAGRVPLTPDA